MAECRSGTFTAYGRMSLSQRALHWLNPKRAGLFCLFQVRGGGGGADSAPPSDLGRGAAKNSEIWHVRRVSRYEHADEIAILKIQAFFNYANLC